MVIYKDKLTSYSRLLEKAKLPTLKNRSHQDIYILVNKVENKYIPSSICEIFNTYNWSYNLRLNEIPITSYNTITYGKCSLGCLGPNWNSNWNLIKLKRLVTLKWPICESCRGCVLCSQYFFGQGALPCGRRAPVVPIKSLYLPLFLSYFCG